MAPERSRSAFADRHDISWSRAVTSTDIEDIDGMSAAAVDGIASDCVQLEAKPFSSHWTVVRLGPVVVQFGQQDLAILRRVRVPPDKWAFIVPMVVPGIARWDGRIVMSGEIIVCPPRAESYAFDPAGIQFAMISVTPGTVARYIETARSSLCSSAGSHIVRPSYPDVRHLQAELLDVKAMAEERSGAQRRGNLGATAQRICARLTTCLRDVVTRSDRSAAARSRSDIVRRAELFVRDRVGESISIVQLSAAVGVSERSLRNAFYDVYTTSPKRYLKIWQLHQARHALRAADDDRATVTTVATFHGFFELGRFAGEYKALFGEAPSQTLQKAKARMTPTPGPVLPRLELPRRATA
jgi:AraC-like DNA-binding protein